MANLPIVPLTWRGSDGGDLFMPNKDFWVKVDRYVPRLRDDHKADLVQRVRSFARDIESAERAMNIASAVIRVRTIREAADQCRKALMRWEPPAAKERDHDGLSDEEFQEQRREEAALLEVFSDSKVNKSLATVNISFFEGNPVSEFERIERWLSSNVPDRELDPIRGLVKPLTIVRIGDRIMRALMFACDDVLPQFMA
jgi:hypothetical protein